MDLIRAEYTPDDKQEIIESVRRLQEKVGSNGAVFSSGGIGASMSGWSCLSTELSGSCPAKCARSDAGPTHDDVTYEAIAEACGASLPFMLASMTSYFDAFLGQVQSVQVER